ncbi:hypothetical protein HMPREF3025_10965 [Neisseria sp. HMSC070E12]|nr:hypothetical protein HMPREF3025_10965 [Neisseria sp. HMSC070E12]
MNKLEKQQKKSPETSDDLCFEIFNPLNRYKGGRVIPLGKMIGLFSGIWILKEDYYSGLNFKSGQGDEAADSTNSTARRGNAVLV